MVLADGLGSVYARRVFFFAGMNAVAVRSRGFDNGLTTASVCEHDTA